jgi:hypothetical protein
MKKLLCFLLCIVLLHGCENKKNAKNEIPDFTGFKTTVNTTINDVKISAEAEYESFDKLVLTFSLPKSYEGMQITRMGDEYTILYDDLTFPVSAEMMPYTMFGEFIMTCAENIKAATVENDGYVFTSDNHIYKMTLNESNGFQKLTVDGVYAIEFEDFEYVMGHTE